MDLHTPSKWTFWLSIILVVIAIILRVAHVPQVEPYSRYGSWIGLLGYIVLLIGCVFKTT